MKYAATRRPHQAAFSEQITLKIGSHEYKKSQNNEPCFECVVRPCSTDNCMPRSCCCWGGVPLLLSHSLRCQCVAVFVKVKSEFPCGLALHIFYVQCE
jgi:hypothetical protein